jgi:hypothetical protein
MAAAGTNAQIAAPGALRVALITIAAITTLGAMVDFPIAFHDFGHTEPLLVFAQRVTSVKLMVAPLIAGTALFCAITGRLRAAIATLAALMLVAFVADLPSYPIHGFELHGGLPGLFVLIERVVLPLLGVTALVLAIRDRRLVFATVFVALPKIVTLTGVVLFAIGVAVHGF